MLGLSYRGLEAFLSALGCSSGKSSVNRDVAVAGRNARALHRSGQKHLRVTVLGVDGTGAAMAGQDAGLLFLVDVGNQRLIGVEMVDESQADEVRKIVREVMAQVGATELRTDEHSSYEGIVPEGSHRLCLTHWLKSKGKRAWDFLQQAKAEGRPLEAKSMEELLALLRKKPRSPTAPEELQRLVRSYIYARKGLPWKINKLLQHIERTWEKVSNDPVDPTNNVTERLIGLTFKIRSRTMRGFKSKSKVQAHPYLSFYLRGQDNYCDLRKVV
jgi:transposase-like protein